MRFFVALTSVSVYENQLFNLQDNSLGTYKGGDLRRQLNLGRPRAEDFFAREYSGLFSEGHQESYSFEPYRDRHI